MIQDDNPRMRLVHLLRKISVELELARGAFAATHGLHDTDVRALIHLLDAQRAGEAASAGQLATGLGLSSASTTGLIDRLEQAGLVRRERDDHDRRRVGVVVTEAAVPVGWDFFRPQLGGIVQAAAPFTEEELDVVERFLEQAVRGVRVRPDPTTP